MSDDLHSLELPGPKERPKTWADVAYTVFIGGAYLALFAASQWADNRYVGKTDHDKERVEDKRQYESDKRDVESRQAIIITQQQEILKGVTEITTRMETNVRRDQDIAEVKAKLEELKTYVYTHPK